MAAIKTAKERLAALKEDERREEENERKRQSSTLYQRLASAKGESPIGNVLRRPAQAVAVENSARQDAVQPVRSSEDILRRLAQAQAMQAEQRGSRKLAMAGFGDPARNAANDRRSIQEGMELALKASDDIQSLREDYYHAKNAERFSGLSEEDRKLLLAAADESTQTAAGQMAQRLANLDPSSTGYVNLDVSGQTPAVDAAREHFGNEEFPALLEYAKRVRNAETQAQRSEEVAAWAEENPGKAFFVQAGANLGTGLANLDVLANRFQNLGAEDTGYVPLDTNSPMWRAANDTRDLLSGGVAGIEARNEGRLLGKEVGVLGGQQAGSWLYQAGASTLNNVVNMGITALVTGGLGLSGKAAVSAAKGISGALQGSQVASGVLLSGKEQGYNDTEAVGLGVLAAAIEALTESESLETLLSGDKTLLAKTVNTVIKNPAVNTLVKGVAAEAGEEAVSSLLNKGAEVLLLADRSSLLQSYYGYLAQGMSEKEAVRNTIRDLCMETSGEALAGAFGGLFIGGGKALFDAAAGHGAVMEKTGPAAAAPAEPVRDAGQSGAIKEAPGIATEQTPAAEDSGVQAAQELENLVQEAVKAGTLSKKAAENMKRMYNGEVASRYVGAYAAVYLDGVNGIEAEQAAYTAARGGLNAAQFKAAYQMGVIEAQHPTAVVVQQKAAAEVKAAVKGVSGRRGSVDTTAITGIKLSGRQRNDLKVYRALAEALGVDIRLVASPVNEGGRHVGDNGRYDPKTNSLEIDIYAEDRIENGQLTTAAMLTMSHELTHYIKRNSPEGYKTLETIAQQALEERSDGGLQELVRRKMEDFGIGEEEAMDEVIADTCQMMLKDSRIFETVAKENRTLAQKVRDWLRNAVTALRRAYQGLQAHSTEAKLLEKDIENLAKIQKAWDEALARAVRESEDVFVTDAPVQMSVRSVNGKQVVWIENSPLSNRQLREPKAIAAYIAQHIGEVYTIIESGQRVYIGKDLPGEYAHSKDAQALRKTRSAVYIAKNRAAGELGLLIENAASRRWEKTKHPKNKNAQYGMYRYDVSFAFSGKAAGNSTVSAYDAELIIRNASDGKKYLYDIVNIKKNTAIERRLLNMNRMHSPGNPSVQVANQNSVSNNSISQNAGNVNSNTSVKKSRRDSNGRELSAAQVEYFAGSMARDEQGRLLVMYHGARKGAGFTVFHDWQYFTRDKKYAMRYTDRNEDNLYEVYLDVKKPFDTRDPEARRIYEQEFYGEYGGSGIQDTGLPDWTDGYDLAEFIEDHGYDFDAIILDEGGDMVNGEPVKRAESWVVRSSQQVKKTDNLAPTNAEDIRYSRRGPESYLALEEQLEDQRQQEAAPVDDRTALIEVLRPLAVTDGERYALDIYEKRLNRLHKARADAAAAGEGTAAADRAQVLVEQAEKKLLEMEALKPLADLSQRLLDEQEARLDRKTEALEQRAQKKLERKAGKAAEYRREMIVERARARAMEQQRDAARKARDRGIVSRRRGQLLEKLERLHKDVVRRFQNPTHRRYIPPELASTMVDVLEYLDMRGEETYRRDGETVYSKSYASAAQLMERLRKLAGEYEKLQDASGLSWSYDENIREELARLADAMDGKSRVRDLELDALELVYSHMKAIHEQLSDADRMLNTEKGESIHEAGEQLIREMAATKGRTDTAFGRVSDTAMRNALTPMRLVARMTEYRDDSVLQQLFDRLLAGDHAAQRFEMESRKMFDRFAQDERGRRNERWDTAAFAAKDFGLKDADGEQLLLTEMQAIQLCMSWARETASGGDLAHLSAGGATIPDAKLLAEGKLEQAMDKARGLKVTAEVIGNIYKKLDAWDRSLMEQATAYFNGKARDAINRTTIKTKHRPMATEEKYIPFAVDANYLVRELQGNNDLQQTLDGLGMTKQLKKHAGQPLIITGLDRVLDAHISNVAKLSGLAIPIRDFEMVWNVRGNSGVPVREVVERRWGAKGVAALEQAVRDLQGHRTADGFNRGLNAITGRWVSATLNWNPGIVLKQMSGLPAAYGVLAGRDPFTTQADFVYTVSHASEVFREIDAHTATHWQRRRGFSTQELGEINEAMKNRRLDWLKKHFGGGYALEWMDIMTTATFWRQAKQDILRTGKYAEGSEEFWQAVTALYERAIEETQPVYDTLHRPEIQRTTNALIKGMTMFQSQSFQNTGMIWDAAMRLAAAKRHGAKGTELKEARRQLIKAAGSQVYSAAVFIAMGALVNALTHRADDWREEDTGRVSWKAFFADMGWDLADQFFGLVLPVLGEIGSNLTKAAVTGEAPYFSDQVLSVSTTESVGEFFGALTSFVAKWSDREEDLQAKDFEELGFGVAELCGIPLSNLKRTLKGLWQHVQDAVNGEFGSFEAGYDVTSKQYAGRLEEAVAGEGPEAPEDVMEEWRDRKASVQSTLTKVYKPQYRQAAKEGDTRRMNEIRRILNASGEYSNVEKTLRSWLEDG